MAPAVLTLSHRKSAQHRREPEYKETKAVVWRRCLAMDDRTVELDDSEEQNLLICDIADQMLEAAATTKTETRGNITWYHCPTGLTICRP